MLPFKLNKLYALFAVSVFALLMAIGWHVERTNHKAYRIEIKALAAIQKADNERKEASLSERLNELSEAHKLALSAGNLERQNIQERLQNEIKRNRILNRTVNRLQNDSARRVPQIPINPEGCPTAKPNSNRTIDTLVDAGKSCYLDYKYLYDAWQAVCEEYGCD